MTDSVKTTTPLNITSTGNKKKKSSWNDTCECVKESQDANKLWKEAGCPNQLHPLFISRKLASRNLSRAQRQAPAQAEHLKFQHIIKAFSSDQKLFNQLVREQCSNISTHTTRMILDGIMKMKHPTTCGWFNTKHISDNVPMSSCLILQFERLARLVFKLHSQSQNSKSQDQLSFSPFYCTVHMYHKDILSISL